ncbi:uncharacterized protein N7479_005172 [Penicillium vulpinum]|uniref:Uncharacterized protein n=1 Tax=Penicillium vulpinum TaxID=29845 RepID=A0A1V6RFQ8_9EURO|nr:uncharacterized protein N7479_005172 [Penicillium vulpinum]KAJ5958022.1 hypothetical protein N7479_005172 [Penicillium vulpinum]OQE00309.1 hypothetical protein PENVUL_c054G09386 [Penicillium vulpinum]
MAIPQRPLLKPALYVLSLLGTYHTWGRTIVDGTLVHLLQALHGGKEYILPGTDSPLRTSITGIYWPVDYLLDILIVFFWEAVDGSHPSTSAIGIYFLSQYFSILTGIYVDGLRLGQSRAITPVRTMLWLLLFQMMAIACTGSFWALWYIAASPLIAENVSLPELQRRSVAASWPLLLVLPSLVVGYVLPAVAMALPSPKIVSNDFQQLALVTWNVFPLGVFLVHKALWAIFPSSGDTSISASAHLKAIRILNAISMLVSFTVHVALSSMSLTTLLFPSLWEPGFISEFLPATLVIPPVSFTQGTTVGHGVRSFFLWDQIFGYMVAILVAWLQLRTVIVARGNKLGWMKLVVGIVGGTVIAGPGSVCLAINWIRDEILLNPEDSQRADQKRA